MTKTNYIRPWRVPVPLSGHAFFYGRIGSGKSVKMITIAQGYHSRGYKIWDMFGGKRNEGAFWTLPNDDKELWEKFESETYEFTHEGPKEYKVNLLYPMFSKELPKRLPTTLPESPRVKSKIFTIPIKEIKLEDIRNVIGEFGGNSTYTWERVLANITKNTYGPEIDYLFDTKLEKSKNLSLYKLFLKTLIDNHTIAGSGFDLNIDIIAESKEKDVISILCLDYVPERFKLFIMGYVQRKIREALLNDKINKRNIGIYRETSLFMKLQDSSISKGDAKQVFRNQFSDLARYGRDGFFIFADTQSPNEVKGLIEGQEDLLCITEMPSQADRETVCKPLKSDNRMSDSQIRAIAVLPIHQICVIPRGERARILRRIAPPRTRYWKEGKGNFYTIWAKEKDTWMKTLPYKEMIYELHKQSLTNVAIKKAEELKKINETKVETEGNESKVNSKKSKDIKKEEVLLDEDLKALDDEISKYDVEFEGSDAEEIDDENLEDEIESYAQ